MGRYVTWDDVVGRYPDVPKILDSAGIGSYWLNYAEAEVDARLGRIYTAPFSPTPDTPLIVQDLSIDLTYYKIALRQDGAERVKKYIDERFEGLLAGTIVIPGASGTTIGATLTNTPYHSAFGRDSELNWTPDCNQLDAEQDARDA